MAMTPQDVLKMCQEKQVRFVDLRFMDFPGLWQHTTAPVEELSLDSFDNGIGFDGSSIRGWHDLCCPDHLFHSLLLSNYKPEGRFWHAAAVLELPARDLIFIYPNTDVKRIVRP